MIITIDGPVASGKSSVAAELAAALDFVHLDSGAIYRAVTLLAMRNGISGEDKPAVLEMLRSADIAFDDERVFLNGEDVSDEIRLPQVSRSVRPFAENPQVRDHVNVIKRRLAAGKNIVIEGRDSGTVIFPDADLKIFLTATPEERARRRYEELIRRGTPQDFDEVLRDLKKRDHADMNRPIAPLVQPEDAVVFDSTGLDRTESVRRLLEIAHDSIGGLK
jgi:cytidylate kinase